MPWHEQRLAGSLEANNVETVRSQGCLFRDYPLPMHKEAPKAYEAGYSGNEQGKFWEMHVEADIKAGAAVGVRGTPAFSVNGQFINGAQPFEAFPKIIDAELKA